jgi:hypothetical protein
MAITEIVSKQLAVLKADASQFKAEMKSAGAVEQKVMKDRLDGMEREIQTRERAGQKFGLYVAAAAAGWGILSSSVKKYEERLVSMGKSGESELKKLRDTTGELSRAQDNLQISIAKVAMAAAPAARALGDMANELANIVGGVASLLDSIPGGGAVGTGLKWSRRLANPTAMAGWALGEARDRFGGTSGGVGAWFANREVDAFELVMSEMEAESAGGLTDDQQREVAMRQWAEQARLRKARADAAKGKRKRGGGPRVDPYAGASADIFGQIGATSGYSSGRYSQSDLDEVFGMGSAPVASGMGWEGISVPASALENLKRLQEELIGDQRQSMLQRIFGDVSEFDTYATAFQGLEQVVTAGFSAWIDGSKGVGQAMKEALHGFAKNLAGEALLQALRHGAYALGSLAFGDIKGASTHGIAAAKWGAVAVAAGVVGKVTAPSAGAGGGSANANAAAGIGYGGSRSGGEQAGYSVTIVQGDGFSDSSPRYVARRARRAMDLASRYAPYNGGQPG